jgi:uncharacterized membrane protein YczE
VQSEGWRGSSDSMVPRLTRPLAWARLVVGLWLFAAGIVLALRSGLGVSPWDVFHDGIRQVTPLSFGVATILLGVLLVGVGALLGVRPGPGTVANMLLIGVFVDLLLAAGVPQDLASQGLVIRLSALGGGVALVALGSALYIGAGLGSGPRDSLMLAISGRTGWRIGLVRALIEMAVLIAGALLGGSVGIGTVLFAFGIGPAVEATFKLLRVDVRPRSTSHAPAGSGLDDAPRPNRMEVEACCDR